MKNNEENLIKEFFEKLIKDKDEKRIVSVLIDCENDEDAITKLLEEH